MLFLRNRYLYSTPFYKLCRILINDVSTEECYQYNLEIKSIRNTRQYEITLLNKILKKGNKFLSGCSV